MTATHSLAFRLPEPACRANAYGGTQLPIIVGNIRVDQAWGLFQISAAAQEVNASYNVLNAASATPNNLSEISGHPDNKWGGSVMAALQIKNIPTGAGDDFKIDATYAKGHTKQVISTSGGSPSFADVRRHGVLRALIRASASVSQLMRIYSGGLRGGATQGLKLTEAWGVRGAFNHNWDPFWSTSFWGSYAEVRYNGGQFDSDLCQGCFLRRVCSYGNTQSADYTCNPDFNIAQVGMVTRWTPVKNLTFSAEVGAFFLDQKFTGYRPLSQLRGPQSRSAVYEFKDQSTVFLNVRVQRNF